MSTTSWSGATPRRADNAHHISTRIGCRRSSGGLGLVLLVVPRHRQLPVPGVDLTPSHYDGADRAAEE